MIPKILSIGFFLSGVLVELCFSQTSTGIAPRRAFFSKIEIGAGVIFSNSRGEYAAPDQVVNPGLRAGISCYHSIGSRFDIQGALHYERKGNKTDRTSTYQGPGGPTTVRNVQGHNLNYISLNICPRFMLDSRQRFYVGAGIYSGFMVGTSTYTDTYTPQGDLISIYYAVSDDNYSKYDFGISMCVGMQVALNERLSIHPQFTASIGLVNVHSPDLPATPYINNCVSAGVGLQLNK